jgi:hypothetical protein
VEHSKVDEASTITNELADGLTAPVVAARKPIRICRFCADPDCDNPLFCQSYEPPTDDSSLETGLMDGMAEEASALVSDMWGNALFSEHTLLLIEVEGVASSFVLHGTERIVLGRADGQPRAHFLDLTPYKAHIQGVSREHAAISQSGHTLMLTDLGSTNGTFLNEQRLVPNQPRILRDGDMIRLGHLVTYVRFR